MKNEILYSDTYASPMGTLFIYTNDSGEVIVLDTVPLQPESNYTVEKQNLGLIKEQLEGYFKKRLTVFQVQFKLAGTPFQLAVWKAVAAVPYGTTTTYQGIAAAIGKPAAVRAVGNAVGANPLLLIIPCHRVITSAGAPGGYRAGKENKEFLLKLEGAKF